ncbi:TonB-siderophor: TonB-dependent siderophore receptor [compost metagenome]
MAEATGGRTSFQNAGRTLRRGFELGIEAEFDEQWSASLAYTRLSATYDSSFESGGETIDEGNHLPGIPASSLYGELVWRPLQGISMGWEGQYRSKVYVDDSNEAKPAPSYGVFNWRTQFEQVSGPWTFRQLLRVDNLFDRQYVGSVIVGDSNGHFYEAAPGRSWYAGATVELRF